MLKYVSTLKYENYRFFKQNPQNIENFKDL